MAYIILISLITGITCIDYIPGYQMMARPLYFWYLGVCLFCFVTLIPDQIGVSVSRIATVLIRMIQKIYGA